MINKGVGFSIEITETMRLTSVAVKGNFAL